MRGFQAKRLDLTKQDPVRKVSYVQAIDKKGRPIIENGKDDSTSHYCDGEHR